MGKAEKAAAFSLGVVLGIALVGFGRSIGWALNKGFTFTLLSRYTESALVKGAILGIEGLLGVAVPILVGWYSDIARWRMGRRKPFILVGGVAAGLAIYGAYLAYSTGAPLAVFTALIALFYLSMHVATAPYRALMPDLVETGYRGRASGVITLLEVFGNIFGFIVGAYLWDLNESYPFLMGLILIPATVILLFIVVKEPETPPPPGESLAEYLSRLLGKTDILKFYAAQLLWWFGFELVAVFFVGAFAYILYGAATGEAVKEATGTAVFLMGLFNIAAVLGALPGGWIYDKVGRIKAVLIGTVGFAAPILYGLFARGTVDTAAALFAGGLGWGILLAASYPVIADMLSVLKEEHFNGRYYGVFEATRSLPLLIASVAGGAIIDLAGGNYRVVFPVAAAAVFLSIPLILGLHILEVGEKSGSRAG